MRFTPLIAGAVSSEVAIVDITAVFAQSGSNGGSVPTRKRDLFEYTASGDLMPPKHFNEWVYVGSPLTSNALNGGKAIFLNFTERGLVDSFNHEATERFATA